MVEGGGGGWFLSECQRRGRRLLLGGMKKLSLKVNFNIATLPTLTLKVLTEYPVQAWCDQCPASARWIEETMQAELDRREHLLNGGGINQQFANTVFERRQRSNEPPQIGNDDGSRQLGALQSNVSIPQSADSPRGQTKSLPNIYMAKWRTAYLVSGSEVADEELPNRAAAAALSLLLLLLRGAIPCFALGLDGVLLFCN